MNGRGKRRFTGSSQVHEKIYVSSISVTAAPAGTMG